MNRYENMLLPVNRDLTEKEELYRDRLIEWMYRTNYVPKDGEMIAQCLSYIDHYRYYCAYWFESNYANLYSAYWQDIRLLNPTLKIGGKKHKRETYDLFPDYVREHCNVWEKWAIKGYEPKYWFYTNSFPYTEGLSTKKKLQVKQQNIVACYFDPHPELLKNKKTGELHHIEYMDFSKAPEESNRADRIQLLAIDSGSNLESLRDPQSKQHSYVHTIGANYKNPAKVEQLSSQMIDGVLHILCRSALIPDAPVVDVGINPDSTIKSLRYIG